MKRERNSLILILVVVLIAASCNRPVCHNKNSIFDKYDISSFEYKAELIRAIEKIGQKNLSYWFESYTKENEKEYMIINIQNDSLCAQGKILVTDWNKIEGIKKTKGQGYVGAELKGLTFNIENDSNKIELIFRDIARIAD